MRHTRRLRHDTRYYYDWPVSVGLWIEYRPKLSTRWLKPINLWFYLGHEFNFTGRQVFLVFSYTSPHLVAILQRLVVVIVIDWELKKCTG